MRSRTKPMKRSLSALSLVLLTLIGSLGLASSASAEGNGSCQPALGGTVPNMLMPGVLFDYTFTPNPWTDAMQGQTATVTVTGKTQAMVPLALMSYKTTKPARWPQAALPDR